MDQGQGCKNGNTPRFVDRLILDTQMARYSCGKDKDASIYQPLTGAEEHNHNEKVNQPVDPMILIP